MTESIAKRLEQTARRLRKKQLFGAEGDSLSLRIPGTEELLLADASPRSPRRMSLAEASTDLERIHGGIYRMRPDVGAMLVGTTHWTVALVAMGGPLPTSFDEQARHLGNSCPPVQAGDWRGLEEGMRSGGNALTFGSQRIVLGSTANRVVLNADLFEKCAKAFVIASSTAEAVRPLPRWARQIWIRRLRSDQARAAKALDEGRIPEGMDAY